ncbi:MAG: hypothetical protein R2751_11135 [Bacteroidales bacterium]
MGKRFFIRFAKVLAWIVAGFVALVLLLTLGFYLGRGWILEKAVSRANESQPGEIRLGTMNLIPFKGLPDVSLQLRDLNYFESAALSDSAGGSPILTLGRVDVSLDVVELIRGNIRVSQLSLEQGTIRLERYADSLMNLEKALGVRFDSGEGEEPTETALPDFQVNLERMELDRILLLWDDQTTRDQARMQVNHVESAIHYYPDSVLAGVQLDLDVNSFKYLTYKTDKSRNIQLETEVSVDLQKKRALMLPTSMKFSGLAMEANGFYDFMASPLVHLDFQASNTGLDVLNFIFQGILDLDEIEQIGGGEIRLAGNVHGELGDKLPQLQIEGQAEDIGFRIKAIQRDVTGIGFHMTANSGVAGDLSDATVRMQGFRAEFPEGVLEANMTASNGISPEVKLEVNGDVDLAGLEQMVGADELKDLQGQVQLKGAVQGRMDADKGFVLDPGSQVQARLFGVGFDYGPDAFRGLSGEISLADEHMGSRGFDLAYNGTKLHLQWMTSNLLQSLTGARDTVGIHLAVQTDILDLLELTGDSALAAQTGGPLRDVHLEFGALLPPGAMDSLLAGAIPGTLDLEVDSLTAFVPVFPALKHINASVHLEPERLTIARLRTGIGQSDLRFAGSIGNYRAFLSGDTAAFLNVRYGLASDLLRARDLMVFNDSFLLPEEFLGEELSRFRLEGNIDLPLAMLLSDHVAPDVRIRVETLEGALRYYPLPLHDFRLDAHLEDDHLTVHDLQGKVGENNLKLRAEVFHMYDRTMDSLHGSLSIASDYLNVDQLMDYRLPGKEETEAVARIGSADVPEAGVSGGPAPGYPADPWRAPQEEEEEAAKLSFRLDTIDYPDFALKLDIGELHYGTYHIDGIQGGLRSTRNKIFYLDSLRTSGGSGGKINVIGQFNVSNPYYYTLSARLDLKEMNVNDLDFEMQNGDSIYTLQENFQGLVSADGMAEVFLTPDLKVDMSTTTAVFNYRIDDGAIINFEPLQAAAKYLDGKDLSHVKFGTLRNSFPMTLVDGRILIPLTIVESTAGQLLIEGEQGLDGNFMYLLRMPVALVRGAVASVLSNADDGKEDEIARYERGKFLVVTVHGEGDEIEVKTGDKRDKFNP